MPSALGTAAGHLAALGVPGERGPVRLRLGAVGVGEPGLAGVDGHRDQPVGVRERRLGPLERPAASALAGSADSVSLSCTSVSLTASGPATVASTSHSSKARNLVRLPEGRPAIREVFMNRSVGERADRLRTRR